MSRAYPFVSDRGPTSGGRISVTQRRCRSRGSLTRLESRASDPVDGVWLLVSSVLMAKVKPDSVRLEDGHHTPGGASLGHGFS
jgi:hypothetical protein